MLNIVDCPHCSCRFGTQSDLDQHIVRFGNSAHWAAVLRSGGGVINMKVYSESEKLDLIKKWRMGRRLEQGPLHREASL